MAADFKAKEGVAADIYTDPGRRTYAALGARRDMAAAFNPRTLLASARSISSGHFQTATAGDALQQGGELVVTPEGDVRFLHLAGFAGDHAGVGTVLAALQPA
jgi:hypothetical protein